MTRLSIVTINVNNAAGLQKTIDSVREQTFNDFEHIIIDGGSTDESASVMARYSQLPLLKGRVMSVSERDSGVYNAQNKGILKATGEYCFFLNSGDYLCSDTVLESVFRRKLSADVVYGNLLVYSGQKLVGRVKGSEGASFLDIYSSTIKHQAAFIKRDLFRKYGLYDESLRIVADWAFFLKTVGLNGASLKYVDVDISCFREGGLSYSDPELCRTERQRVLDQYLPDLIQNDYLLFERYRGIRWIDRSRLGWLLFRMLAKTFKTYYASHETKAEGFQ